MVDLWQISILGEKPELVAVEKQLEASLEPPLSFSLFEDDLPLWRLEIIVDQQPDPTHWKGCGENAKIEKLASKNWVIESLRYLTPVEAGRFYVHGSHDQPALDASKTSICIPAGMAFGTGHHETTSGCLLELDQMLSQGERFSQIADLGTGAGILAIAAARTLPAQIIASDIDPEAILVAKQNAQENSADSITFLLADGVDHSMLKPGGFDLVFANILAGPLIAMAAGISALLAPSGQLILAGLLHEQAEAVASAYLGQGLKIIRSRQLGDWAILVAQAAR